MKLVERPVSFACGEDTLYGIVSEPPAGVMPSGIGVLIVVGGPQYRVGAHRQFVQMARTLAGAGHVSMRFDVRGMGDSTGAQRSFEALDDDIAAAMDALIAHSPHLRGVALWGLCDGASAALMYWGRTGDRRVSGFVLLNPWVRSDTTLAKAHVKHYYLHRLKQAEFWKKLLTGGVAGKAIADLTRNLKLASTASERNGPTRSKDFRGLMVDAATRFDGPIALVLSGNDLTAREFEEHAGVVPEWRTVLNRTSLQRVDLMDADHTFSGRNAEALLQSITTGWLARSEMSVANEKLKPTSERPEISRPS